MHILLTGATGAVGAHVAPALIAAGHEVTRLARRPLPGAWLAFDLAAPPLPLPAADALVHLAFDHLPGAYRGGEGADPDRFLRLNRDGSLRLFEAARGTRVIFLSTRAIYGDRRRGETLRETDPPEPDSLYGRMKLEVEAAADASVRATGIYGTPPGSAEHKRSGLFADYLAGRPAAPRAATELHGADLAAALLVLLARPSARGAFNASDFMLDRHDLLDAVRTRTRCPHPLPPRAPGPPPGVMATDRLRALGWQPGGPARLAAFLDALPWTPSA